MIFIGVDPGASGGIAAVAPYGPSAWPMPPTERDLWNLLVRLTGEAAACDLDPFLSLEKVGPMPGQGVTSMFSFGQNYGMLRGMIIALCVPFEDVQPKAWQKAVGAVLPRGAKLVKDMSKAERNARRQERMNLTKSVAQQLFPSLRVTHATAAALLIAEAARRKHASAPLFTPAPAFLNEDGSRILQANGKGAGKPQNGNPYGSLLWVFDTDHQKAGIAATRAFATIGKTVRVMDIV